MERGAQATGLRRHCSIGPCVQRATAIPWRAYGRPVSPLVKLQWELANRLVYKKFRDGVGGRMRRFISGGAPLATELAEFFTTVGLTISQGYGLTETSPVVSNNIIAAEPHRHRRPPLAGRRSAHRRRRRNPRPRPVRHDGLLPKPEETREAISPDGWLATGDIGELDEDGYLVITDRKKELLKTAGGKLVAPAPIENALKTSRVHPTPRWSATGAVLSPL